MSALSIGRDLDVIESLEDALFLIFDSDFADETGSGIIKFLAAMKSGWVDAGKAAGGSASIITKALSSIGAGWASLGIVGKAGLVIAAIAAIVAVVDALTVSAAEATENMNKAFEEYDTAKQKVQSVNSELQTANERILELQAKGGLTFVEESELEKLRESVELLSIQADLAQKEEARKASEAAEAAEEAFNKNYGKYDVSKSAVDEHEAYADWSMNNAILFADEKDISSMLAGIRQFKQLRAEVEKGSDDWEHYNGVVEDATAAVEGQLKELIGYKDKIKSLPEEQQKEYEEFLNLIDSSIELIYQELDPAKWKQIKLDDLLADNELSGMKDQLIDMAAEMKTVGISVEDVESKFPRLAAAIKAAGIEMKDFVDYINSSAGVLDVDGAMAAITNRFTSSDGFQKVDWRSAQMALDSFDEWLKSLSPDDLAIVYEMSLDTSSATWSLDEWQSKLAASKETAQDSLRDIKTASEETLAVLSGITGAQKILNSQGTGKSISVSDLNAEGMEDYASALEYVNGVYQLNAEKVNAIIEAKAKEQVAVNDANKAYAQSEYLKNAKQIEKYREELARAEKANNGTADAIRENINNLLNENSALRDECAQYDLMSSVLIEATNAYQTWLNARSASQTGDMFDGALAAVKQINDVLNNSESELFGRVGRTDYKAAVDFIVPDSVDHEDAAAVNSYLDSISNMFTFDDNGNRTGLNIANFIEEASAKGLIALNEAKTAYEIAGGTMMEDFARELGLSLPLVRAIFGELEEFGAEFDWADEASQTLGDLTVAAVEAAEQLRSKLGDSYQMSIDTSGAEKGLDSVDEKVAYLEKTISDMQEVLSKKEELQLDDSDVVAAEAVIRAAVAQKQMLTAPDIMMVDTSVVEGELGRAIEVLQEFQRAKDALDMAKSLGIDTSEAQANLDAAAQAVQNLDANITSEKALNIDTSNIDTIAASLDALTADLIVKAGVDESAVIGYQQEEHNADGTVTWDNNTKAVDAYAAAKKKASGVVAWYNDTKLVKTRFYATGTIQWSGSGSGSGGSGRVNGTANASGSAKMRGDWRARGGRSLVGELGKFLCPLTQ